MIHVATVGGSMRSRRQTGTSLSKEKEIAVRTPLTALLVATLLIGLFALPAGCPLSSAAETGTVRLLVTDKPFPFNMIEQADVIITRVEVLPADADAENNDETQEGESAGDAESQDPEAFDDDAENESVLDDPDSLSDNESEDDEAAAAEEEEEEEETDDDENENDAFLTIFEGEKLLSLLDLRNGRTDLLADAEIPTGTYKQMRLIVTEGFVRLTDEREFPLRVPSGSQTGIKLHFTFDIEADRETRLLLDIDLSRAFKPSPAGNIAECGDIREFKFQPSLGMRLIDLAEAGSIGATITNVDGEPLAAVSVTAYDGETEVTTTSTESDGTFVLTGLEAGTYRIEFSASGYTDAEVIDVVVGAGEQTNGLDVVLTEE